MKIIRKINEIHEFLDRNKRENRSVGFVPTMGYLHEGHLALVQRARNENDLVVMSIFVNPAQFGPGEDFEAYPRDEERDAKLAAKSGVDVLFLPDRDDMYPTDSGIQILPGAQADVLCGASRPGHFDGVLKVVLKLFNIVDPDRSYFGMKDAQQLAIIETFVRDFNLRTTIGRVPTVREKDGLAKSSRNINLSETERTRAAIMQEALKLGETLFLEGVPAKDIEHEVYRHITENSSAIVNYVSLLSYPSLTSFSRTSEEAIIACALKFEKTRLIDNIIMSTKDESYVSNDDE